MDWKYITPPYQSSSSGSESMLTVETIDNHIYFYADVDSDRALALMQSVRYLDGKLRAEHTSRGIEKTHPLTPIWLHIYSNGGDLFAGFSLADQLKTIKSPIYTIIEGACASAATLIAMSGVHRYITESSFMLVHQMSASIWGTHEKFKDELALQQMAMNRIVAFYLRHTKVQEDEIRDMLKRDTWMDATTCVEKGFVNEVYK